MTAPSRGMVARHIAPVAHGRLRHDPVVLLEGPRTVGKSTLLRQLASSIGATLLDLDDLATRDAVAADPAAFVTGPGPVCVDEYQKAPAILDAIKAELNHDSRPGRFVLTGSTRHDSLPKAAQALTGRLSRLTVYPLAQVELEGTEATLLEGLFADPDATVAAKTTSNTTRGEYIDRVVAGGFPMALSRNASAARHRWFDDYIALTLERDVRELSNIRQADLLPILLRRLAGQTGQVLNLRKAALDAGLDPVTAENYTRLLEAVFLVTRLPAWGRTLSARSGATPKLHVIDSGVAARVLRLTPDKLLRRDPTALTELGHLLETFVVGELARQASWMDGLPGPGHWRTRDNDEVDLVLERDDGAIVAFEVKTAGRVPAGDFKPLRKLATALDDAFVAGVVFYTGERSYRLEDKQYVMPIDRLWTT